MLTARLFFVALLVTAFAMCGVATATAFAEGPGWLVNGKLLKAGEKVKAEGHGVLSFLVEGLPLKIECKTLKEEMTAIGGEPGTDEDTLEYSECSVVNPATGCTVENGKIILETNTKLVFLVRKAAGEKWKTATMKEWLEAAEKRLGDEFTAKKAGEVLGIAKLENAVGETCSMKGEYEIKGTYTGIVNNGLEFSIESSKIRIKGPSGEFEGWAIGFMEYFIVNGKGEPTGESFQVSSLLNGPHWNVAGAKLEDGESAAVTTKNLGDFTLHTTASGSPEVLCTGLSAPTTILGPGESDTEILLSGCTATGAGGSGTCDTLSKGGTPGNVTFPASDELVYTGTKSEAENEEGPLGDLFTPAAGGTTFTTLLFVALGSGTCPSLAVGEVKVNGSVIGEVEPVNTLSTEGMLTFPKTAVKTGFQWLSTGKVLEVKASLKTFGGTSTELGLADLKLESGKEWGAFTT